MNQVLEHKLDAFSHYVFEANAHAQESQVKIRRLADETVASLDQECIAAEELIAKGRDLLNNINKAGHIFSIEEERKIVSNFLPVEQVLELNAGMAEKLNLAVGAQLTVDLPPMSFPY